MNRSSLHLIHWMRPLGLAATLLMGTVAAPAQTTNAPTLEQASQALGRAQSVFTHFTQERHMSLFNEPLRTEGWLCFQQPGAVRWEVDKPYKSILISDGSGVAQFEWVEGRWKKLDSGLAGAMQSIVAQIAGILNGQYARGGKDYSVAFSNSPAGPVIMLTPRNEKVRVMMQAIEVHLAPDLQSTRQVVLRENGGDFTLIQFDKQVVNPHFPPMTFDRAKPAEIETVGRAAQPTP